MKGKFKEYQVEASPDELREKILDYVNSGNLNFEGSTVGHGRIQVWNRFRLFTSRGFHGPLVKLELSLDPAGLNENRTILSGSRVNGAAFNLQFWFVIVLAIVTISIAIYQLLGTSFEEALEYFTMPAVFALLALVFELIAGLTVNNLFARIEKIMIKEGIDYGKKEAGLFL